MMLIENKYVQVGTTNYRLSIERIETPNGNTCYKAYLSDVDSPFTAEITFSSIHDLRMSLEERIKEKHLQGNTEEQLIEQLILWDGEIEI